MRLEPVNELHFQFLYDLLKIRPDESNISHRVVPPYDEHCAYWRDIIDPASDWRAYVICQDGMCRENVPVGYVYLSDRDEIGIHIHPDFQRRGIARRAIVELMDRHPRHQYLANVAPRNGGSKCLFGGLGFSLLQETYSLRK